MPDFTIKSLLDNLHSGQIKALARCISLVENESEGYQSILENLRIKSVPVIGVTGPPGSGKSTLVNALINQLSPNKKIGVIAIDPSSPFNFGALLGDRIRMNEQFGNENVFIRSIASRGSLGGLSDKILEVTDVMRSFGFDYIFIETVGVGQSEVEIAGIADTTIVVLVPEAGDQIQTMKAGLMEIADIFVMNKADRPGADKFANELAKMAHEKTNAGGWEVPVVQTVASAGSGVDKLCEQIQNHHMLNTSTQRKLQLLAEKAYRLIRDRKMLDFSKSDLLQKLAIAMAEKDFNIYQFIRSYE